MVRLIVGNRGTGKTKALIQKVHEAEQTSKGNVVCIEQGAALRFDISSAIRLIDIEEYGIRGADAYYGFLAGLLAGNYDITEIFADSTLRILFGKNHADRDFSVLASFIDKITELTKPIDTLITLTVSCDISELPENIRPLVVH